MIKKIEKIQNFGLFSDFTWLKGCNEFKKFNFFYGWNYSGKTTLSRVFKCFEDREKHPDFLGASFILKTDNKDITEKNIGEDFNIRVFNEEFIEENFKWNDENHKISPVLILGKESIELNNLLSEKETKKQEKEESKSDVEKEKKELEKTIENSLTQKATDIRKNLNITNPREFDRHSLESQIQNIRGEYKKFILDDQTYQSKFNAFRDQRNYEKIPELRFDLKINDLLDKVNNILASKITVQQVIEKLKKNPALNKWVREGIDLHVNEKQCQFCGNELPSDLFERLNKHFSKEFDDLILAISNLESELSGYKDYLEKIQFTDKSRFYDEFQESYENISDELKEYINSSVKNLINELLSKLKEKRNKPFESIVPITGVNVESELKSKITKLNEIIQNNNQKIARLSEEKSKIKEELIKHYSAIAIDDLEYFNKKNEIVDKTNKINEISKEIEKLKGEIEQIRTKLEQQNKGAEKINTYLKSFFADNKLKLKVLEGGTYQIFRDDNIAKNLSTGEKNIISLIYFLTKLEENTINIKETIVFIDDPVSSLDSNHIFSVYGFLKEKLKDCNQVFITTHNFDFFNLLKDFKYNKNDNWNYYLLKKITNKNNERTAIIENLPNVLKKFKSEYNYLFSVLYEFNKSNDKSSYELLYILPNITRRFLEAYLFMKYPDGKKFKEKCGLFFKDIENNRKTSTLKLLDEYSHEENPEHALKFPDIKEIEESVAFILEILEKKDPEHFNALVNSMS